jgi:hypothetical protein
MRADLADLVAVLSAYCGSGDFKNVEAVLASASPFLKCLRAYPLHGSLESQPNGLVLFVPCPAPQGGV